MCWRSRPFIEYSQNELGAFRALMSTAYPQNELARSALTSTEYSQNELGAFRALMSTAYPQNELGPKGADEC